MRPYPELSDFHPPPDNLRKPLGFASNAPELPMRGNMSNLERAQELTMDSLKPLPYSDHHGRHDYPEQEHLPYRNYVRACEALTCA